MQMILFGFLVTLACRRYWLTHHADDGSVTTGLVLAAETIAVGMMVVSAAEMLIDAIF